MNDQQFRAFLDLMMCCDPNPAGAEVDDILKGWADEESRRRGHDGWIAAYHEVARENGSPDAR